MRFTRQVLEVSARNLLGAPSVFVGSGSPLPSFELQT